MTARNWLTFAGMILALAAMIAVYGVSYDPKSPASTTEFEKAVRGDTLRVSARALAGGYAKDRRRADRVFENRLVVVTGKISDIDGNWLGEPVVQLEGDRAKRINVSMMFQKAEQRYVDLLNIGETISVLGICVGHEPRYGIRFKQCMLVSRADAKGSETTTEK
jgi:hypothetical protein